MGMGGTPSTTFEGTTGPEGDGGDNKAAGRWVAFLAALIFAPVALAIYAGWLVVFHRARIRWWIPGAVAGVALLFGLITGAGNIAGVVADYFEPWVTALQSENFLDSLISSIPTLLWAQLWLGIVGGSAAAAVSCWWKWVRRPKWEEREINPGPLLKRREERAVRELKSATTPVGGQVSVGVSNDRRDQRFAGGKPGTPYGELVAIPDNLAVQHTLVTGASGAGKSLHINTPIPTPDRGFVPIGDLKVGDLVFGVDGEQGSPVVVLGAFDVEHDQECFEVGFDDGARIIANADHLWTVESGSRRETVSTRVLAGWLRDSSSVEVFLPATRGVPGRADGERVRLTYVAPVESVPVRCIRVSAPDHLFLAGETWLPTHNTTTMLMGMREVIRMGRGLIVLDCKGDPDIAGQLSEWADRYGREFYHWSFHDKSQSYSGPASGPAFYDPVGRGDPSRRKDLIMGAFKWDVEYYKTVNSSYLQDLFRVVNMVPPPAEVSTLTDVVDLLTPENLVRRAQNLPLNEETADLVSGLSVMLKMNSQEQSAINNLRSRLREITTSIIGPWVRKDPEGLRDINLRDVAENGAVAVFSLDSSNYEETASLMAGLIVQDLITVTSELRNKAKSRNEPPLSQPCHVYVDEFSAVSAENMVNLVNKARDAMLAVTVATQTLADLRAKNPQFAERVIGAVGSFIIHRSNMEEEATTWAGLTGKVERMVTITNVEHSTGLFGGLGSSSNKGSGQLRPEEGYAVRPGEFQRLAKGHCVFVSTSPSLSYVHPVKVIPENGMAVVSAHGGIPQLGSRDIVESESLGDAPVYESLRGTLYEDDEEEFSENTVQRSTDGGELELPVPPENDSGLPLFPPVQAVSARESVDDSSTADHETSPPAMGASPTVEATPIAPKTKRGRKKSTVDDPFANVLKGATSEPKSPSLSGASSHLDLPLPDSVARVTQPARPARARAEEHEEHGEHGEHGEPNVSSVPRRPGKSHPTPKPAPADSGGEAFWE